MRDGETDSVEGRLRGLQAADDFDKLHHRHGIEEVHADDLRGTLRLRGELRDRDGAGVRGEDGLGPKDAVEIAEESGLDLEFFRSRLDGKVAGGEGFAVEGGALCGREPRRPALRSAYPWRLRGRGSFRSWPAPRSRKACCEIAEHDVEPRTRRDMGDAVAHGSGAEHCDGFDGCIVDHCWLRACALPQL